jgi:23S rRNA pseudouridine2457 synthase
MATLVLFNKPYGVVCQFSPHEGRETLRDYLPQRTVYPAGRLDADSEGLVVLTADGGLQNSISDPAQKLPKTYCAQVEGIVTPAALATLRQGVTYGGYTTRPAEAREIAEPTWLWERVPPIRYRREIPTAWIELRLVEGRNRQVRRMTAAVGLPTLRLVRQAVGPWDLSGLAPGEWREVEVVPPTATARQRKQRTQPSTRARPTR